MQNQIRGVTLDEIAEFVHLEKELVRKYLEGPLKEDVEKERLILPDGKYDPFTIDLVLIQLDVDAGIQNLIRSLDAVRAAKGRKEN